MARLARAIFPGIPHHVTQRGNGRAQTFFTDADYRLYRDLLTQSAAATGLEVWAWVLMPNHVHLIVVPPDADAIRRTLAPVHRHYAGHMHRRLKRSGHFWQGRFGCVAMDEAHLDAALRYVSLNPVRAGLVRRAADWPWSSLHAHLGNGGDDRLTSVKPVLSRYPDFAQRLAAGEDAEASERLRRRESIGRPLGSPEFIKGLEADTGRSLSQGKRGPKPRELSALSPK